MLLEEVKLDCCLKLARNIMSSYPGHEIPSDDGTSPNNAEEEARWANVRQFCLHARAPIIWPRDLAVRHHQQMEFLFSQLDQR